MQRLRTRRGNFYEFAPALFVLFFLIFFPLIDLAGLAAGFGTVFFICHQNASIASTQTNFDSVLSALEQSSAHLNSSALARFSRLRPVGGHRGMGSDLFIEVTSWRGDNATRSYGPNAPLTAPVDPSSNIYQVKVCSTYDVGPFLAISTVPLLGEVPGLGKPARLRVAVRRNVEYPQALVNKPAAQSFGSTSALAFDNSAANSTTSNNTAGWNYPTIYEDIRAMGQEVIKESVLQVDARNYDWTDTEIDYQQGLNLWFDFRADGLWRISDHSAYVDAGGNATGGWLIGKAGGGAAATTSDEAISFVIGKRLVNYRPSRQGRVYLRVYDQFESKEFSTDNDGLQTVRVILTR